MTAPGIEVGSGNEALAEAAARSSLALARCFAAGATLWCAAPRWPAHAQHVSVEFIHPVIVGKRALPAVAVPSGADAVRWLRPLVRAGDVVALIGPAADPATASLARRAPVWGARTLWLGCGPRPEPGAADHVLWVDDSSGGDESGDPTADGRLALQYHLLWELTHVCFEHPGLLRADRAEIGGDASGDAASGERCDADGHCITCADDAFPAEVTAVADGGLVSVRSATGAHTVDVGLLDDVAIGDLLLVHAGTALTLLERETARAG